MKKVSEYLQRPEVAAIKHSQRALMVLVYRKILASSSFAIAQTIKSLMDNLDRQLKGIQPESIETLVKDVEGYEEEIEEIAKREDGETIEGDTEEQVERERAFTSEEIEAEKKELSEFKKLAEGIQKNSKGEALITALKKAFEHNKRMGWPEKAVIFTESRRTQKYLFNLLSNNGYTDKITLFSGTNDGPIGKRAYDRWEKERVRHDKEMKLSKEAAIRDALIHEFRNYMNILIVTEAGAEGINHQFCNIVVNYDLPWNPQRIEQRIGRCHRYGQKYDVVVLNFLNRKNAADNRVFELLDKKLKLFDGIFGASDEILGAIGSGVDFKKRILEIYQSCRTEEEIHRAFDALQSEFSRQISETMLQARAKLLEHFDDEVRVRLRTRDEEIRREITAFDEMLLKFMVGSLNLSDYNLEGSTYYINIPHFPPKITLNMPGDVTPGTFYIGKGKNEAETAERLHLGHPLVRTTLGMTKEIPVDKICHIMLAYTAGKHKIAAIEPYIGKSGYCVSYKFSFAGLEEEDHMRHLFFIREKYTWIPVNNDCCRKMMTVTAFECENNGLIPPPVTWINRLSELIETTLKTVEEELLKEIGLRNEEYYEREMDKLELYSEEAVLKMQDDLKKIEDAWKEAKSKRQRSLSFEDRMSARKEVQRLEHEYSKMADKIAIEKKRLFEEKDRELKNLEKKLKVKVEKELIAQAYWRMD